MVNLPLEQARTELIKYVHSRHPTLFCTCHTLCSYCMHVVCNVTYVLVEYSDNYLQYMYCEALNINNLTKHSSNLQQHFKLQTALVSLYEHKIQKIQSCYGDDSISLSQKEQQIQISFRCMHVFLSRGFVWTHKSICFYQTSKIPS